MTTKLDKLAKQQKAQRVNSFRNDVVFAHLEATWSKIAWQAQLGNIPTDEAEDIANSAFDYFLAERAFESGITKEEFLEEMGEAWDDVVAAQEGEDEEEPEPEELSEEVPPTEAAAETAKPAEPEPG